MAVIDIIKAQDEVAVHRLSFILMPPKWQTQYFIDSLMSLNWQRFLTGTLPSRNTERIFIAIGNGGRDIRIIEPTNRKIANR